MMTSVHSNGAQISSVIYLHIPFCRQRCAYCAFNTFVGLEQCLPDYVRALCRELVWLGEKGQHPRIHAVYIGGGTPNILPARDITTILTIIGTIFAITSPLEITLEANPGFITAAYLNDIQQAGVSRFSLGVQSSQEWVLRLFNRAHNWLDVVTAVRMARQAGFTNISLDLIYGVPEQTIAMWQRTLRLALDLNPEHLSLYSLSIEPGTRLYAWVKRGMLPEPDMDYMAEMYELACEMLARHGYEQYEISNWARPGRMCSHNLQYWRREPYLGVGAGAYGFVEGTRYANVRSPREYIERLQTTGLEGRFPLSPAVDRDTIEVVDKAQERAEIMMLGLRLTQEGVSLPLFVERVGSTIETFYADQLRELSTLGLIEVLADRVRLTPKGKLLGNRVDAYFV